MGCSEHREKFREVGVRQLGWQREEGSREEKVRSYYKCPCILSRRVGVLSYRQ